jgi:RHS repeat-associated protein
MSKLDTMFGAIEEKIKILKSQGIETGQFEKRLFALRLRFHAMFHSLNRELIVAESEQILAEIKKTNKPIMNTTSHSTQTQPQPQSGHTFSAKEKDDETGYSYFGARYYDSELSVWLSVDPLAGKYPSMSPFMYCAGNPVILKDPDGKKIIFVNGHFQDNWIGRNFLGASKTGRDYWGNGFIRAFFY